MFSSLRSVLSRTRLASKLRWNLTADKATFNNVPN